MTTLETSNRTFNKKVKALIASELTNVVSFRKHNSKTVGLLGKEGTTIAIWEQTKTGSKVVTMSDY